jgi:hypothetical protein
MLCSAAQNLLGQGDLEAGLAQLWHIHLVICQGQQQPDFWANVRDHARTLRITRHVSRALRLSHHLFETPVKAGVPAARTLAGPSGLADLG